VAELLSGRLEGPVDISVPPRESLLENHTQTGDGAERRKGWISDIILEAHVGSNV
jgi:hypothetical protein